MTPIRAARYALALALAAGCGGGGAPGAPRQPADVSVAAGGITWRLSGSLKYEALYYLNTVVGVTHTLADPELAAEHARVTGRLGAAERDAAARFAGWRAAFGDDVAGLLSVLARPAPEGDLSALAVFFDDVAPRLVEADALSLALRGSAFTAEERTYVGACLQGTATLLRFLGRDGWEARWRGEPLRRVNERIAQLAAALPQVGVDVIALVNARGGKAVTGDTVHARFAHYASGFGLSLMGEGFLLEAGPRIDAVKVVSTAIHELAHDPFPHDAAFAALRDAYSRDPFFMGGVNPGYPTAAFWFSEELTDAFEIVFAAALLYPERPASESLAYLSHANRLAPVIFSLAQQEGFAAGTEPYAAFILRMVDEGKLVPGGLQQQFEAL